MAFAEMLGPVLGPHGYSDAQIRDLVKKYEEEVAPELKSDLAYLATVGSPPPSTRVSPRKDAANAEWQNVFVGIHAGIARLAQSATAAEEVAHAAANAAMEAEFVANMLANPPDQKDMGGPPEEWLTEMTERLDRVENSVQKSAQVASDASLNFQMSVADILKVESVMDLCKVDSVEPSAAVTEEIVASSMVPGVSLAGAEQSQARSLRTSSRHLEYVDSVVSAYKFEPPSDGKLLAEDFFRELETVQGDGAAQLENQQPINEAKVQSDPLTDWIPWEAAQGDGAAQLDNQQPINAAKAKPSPAEAERDGEIDTFLGAVAIESSPSLKNSEGRACSGETV